MLRHLVRLIFRAIGMLIPLVFALLRQMFTLIFVSISSLFVGVPVATERIADNWTAEATNAGIPRDHAETIHSVAKVIAFGILVVGWALILFLLVGLVSMIVS